ncbi:AI-2E family transporter [Zafaria cholistanensis]|uniref:AI-2E family transporter n=1 Tax=Zafaria cholistanensis TaxID=1682741 RepID=A0A5A7NVL3_9MICC|nr:AI-2E family transporter [Zafaria cholistanensis]
MPAGPPAGRLRRLAAALAPLGRRARYAVPPEPEDGAAEPFGPHSIAWANHPIATGFLGAVGVGLALLGFFVLTNVGQLMVWIAVALFIALGLDPLVRWAEARNLPRPLGVLMAMALLALGAAAFFGTLIPTLVSQTGQFVENAPGYVDDFLASEFFLSIDSQFQIRDRLTEEVNKFFADSGAVGGLFGGVIGAGTVIAQTLFGTLTVLVLAVYFLASLPGMKAWAYRLAPRSRRARVQALSEQITNSVGNYVMGQAVVAFLNATYAFIIMSIVGVPFSILLALVVAILAFVPLVGALIAGILVSLIALTVGWQPGITYAVLYFAYLQFEAYFISPRIMHRAVAVPGAVAVIAVIAGGALMGIAGALMAIPLAAAAMLLLKEVFIARQDRR